MESLWVCEVLGVRWRTKVIEVVEVAQKGGIVQVALLRELVQVVWVA